ncbi:CAP domain-containing protein [Marinobacter orientalis]|uniref:CAP domain-containing protein n=1 Tax=Marinobacter orientalis TaxID=1928859 RepID=A0A7Y0RF81_9GAMM|nr:CAP domain-containing protein [Marinobacter orientalis]NMT65134.1 CAP domain-containing protein [Marinobacter orientalis]TGX48921.1 CAP domain-containing protein [Marinobacter orientalis]
MRTITFPFSRPSSALPLVVFLAFPGILVAGDCEMDATDRAMLNRVNEARSEPRQCGDQDFDAAEPLSWNCKLEDAARAHSRDMIEMEFFSHTGPGGVQTGKRVSDRGYSWSAVGENIAMGQNSVDDVVDGWLSSPGHCANIMSTNFTEMGAARVEAPESQYSPFWTQVFARPR